MTAQRVRVVIADDHVPMRLALRQVLEADEFEVVGEAASGSQALEVSLSTRPDVALLDVQMPGTDGIWAAARISKALPDTTIVMLTYSRDEDHVFAALRAGAAGYLTKDVDPGRLAPALRGVLAGEVAMPRSLMTLVIEEFRGRSKRRGLAGRRRGAQLTSREWEVAELLRSGASTDAIALRLRVSPTTVRVHVANILKKLQAPDRAAAIRYLNEP